MILTRAALRALAVAVCAVLAVLWGIAWLAPGFGLQYGEARYLVTATAITQGRGYIAANLPHPIAETGFPPLFPALLAALVPAASAISTAPVWLKALPVAFSILWMVATWFLLRKMGAGRTAASAVICLTAASPGVVAFGSNLFPDSLFALLLTSALLFLLAGRPASSGVCAGLSALARTAGLPIIAACAITLIVRRRFREAVLFLLPAIVLVAPWFGWALAHAAHDPGSGIDAYSASNIFTALEPGDKVIVLLRNIQMLFESPFRVLSGIASPIAAAATALLVIVSLIRRRHLVPDLFLLLYAGMLLCRVGPPEALVAPVLPFVLWLLWRSAASLKHREAIAAAILLLAIVPFWRDFGFVRTARKTGEFMAAPEAPDNWADMQKFFQTIRAHTSADDVLAADLAPLFYLETGRRCIRGFHVKPFDLYYSQAPVVLPPDQLALSLRENHVSYFALTPRDVGGGAALHTALAALERGGILEPLPLEGLPQGYRVLRVPQ